MRRKKTENFRWNKKVKPLDKLKQRKKEKEKGS